jgi:hypothetical protein
VLTKEFVPSLDVFYILYIVQYTFYTWYSISRAVASCGSSRTVALVFIVQRVLTVLYILCMIHSIYGTWHSISTFSG